MDKFSGSRRVEIKRGLTDTLLISDDAFTVILRDTSKVDVQRVIASGLFKFILDKIFSKQDGCDLEDGNKFFHELIKNLRLCLKNDGESNAFSEDMRSIDLTSKSFFEALKDFTSRLENFLRLVVERKILVTPVFLPFRNRLERDCLFFMWLHQENPQSATIKSLPANYLGIYPTFNKLLLIDEILHKMLTKSGLLEVVTDWYKVMLTNYEEVEYSQNEFLVTNLISQCWENAVGTILRELTLEKFERLIGIVNRWLIILRQRISGDNHLRPFFLHTIAFTVSLINFISVCSRGKRKINLTRLAFDSLEREAFDLYLQDLSTAVEIVFGKFSEDFEIKAKFKNFRAGLSKIKSKI
ncbi:MAG: hypothetical protein NZO16_01365 [Deltaproteobacteria bacterium]|nr:hypothetical protein [Deltaproteobacteria bacterium]